MSTSNVIGALGATFSHSHFHVNQTNSIATVTDSGQNLVPFSTTVSSSGSDITYSAGKFTLQPNKTYKLDLAAAAATAAVTFWWYDFTAGGEIGNRIAHSTTLNGGGGGVSYITPTVATEVGVVSLLTNVGINVNHSLSATVEVVASDAAENPLINDQSASNYVDIGNMRIQWGSQAQNSAGVIFPQAFGATPSVTASAGNTDAYIGVSGVSTTGFNWGAYNFNGAFSNATLFTWIAIGLKP